MVLVAAASRQIAVHLRDRAAAATVVVDKTAYAAADEARVEAVVDNAAYVEEAAAVFAADAVDLTHGLDVHCRQMAAATRVQKLMAEVVAAAQRAAVLPSSHLAGMCKSFERHPKPTVHGR